MEKQIKVQTSGQLSSIIDKIVRESMRSTLYQNAVLEKQKQDALTEEDEDLTDDSSDDSSSKTMDDSKEKMKKGEVSASDVIERLNAIRSGRSFKDEDIASKLEEYVGSLSKPERVALLAFLKGISQVVTGEIPATDAVSPDSNPANIEMKKGEEKKKVSIKPVVVKQPEKKQGEQPNKKAPAEDTSGPVPIKPKR